MNHLQAPRAGHRSDQVFQLSLTELAFTIAFLLLLLLGLRIVQTQSERDAAVGALARAGSGHEEAAALAQARADLAAQLRQAGASDPDAVITRLIEAADVRAERDRLRRQVADLDARLSALAPTPGSSSPMHPALGGFDAVASSGVMAGSTSRGGPAGAGNGPGNGNGNGIGTGNGMGNGPARDAGQGPGRGPGGAAGAGGPRDLDAENANLRGQVAFLSDRLAAAHGHGGRDFPPCWADVSGRVQYLLSIETRPNGLVITPAWPPEREAAARALPGLEPLLARPLGEDEFARLVEPLYAWSHERQPECRHYILLHSTIADAAASDRARLLVERYFYKSELPR